jgi:hypothetical protein
MESPKCFAEPPFTFDWNGKILYQPACPSAKEGVLFYSNTTRIRWRDWTGALDDV